MLNMDTFILSNQNTIHLFTFIKPEFKKND
jgi:hypothetical protein